jgi:SAM-dependent methyltransferase
MSAVATPARHGRVRPLLHAGRRVLVDDHPICGECGRAIRPTGPGRWRHLAPGERYPRRSKWLSPGLAELRACRTHEEVAARFPDAGATRADWHEAVRRLERYHAQLAELRRPRPLAPAENPYLELVRLLAAPARRFDGHAYWDLPLGLVRLLDLPRRRRELVDRFAWAIPTEEALAVLVRHTPLLDAGAGTGYWAALLRARGADVVACDLAPPGSGRANAYHRTGRPWTEVRQASAVEATCVHRDRTLLLCWPPHDDDAAGYLPLRAYRGDVVVHVGDRGGASGSARLHRELALNWTRVEEIRLPSWPWLDERLTVYRRNLRRQPLRQRDRCTECGRFVATGHVGRCDACFARRPPALALRAGRHRVEYTRETLAALPPALRLAFEASPQRIR